MLRERRHHLRAEQLDRLFVTAQGVGDEVLEPTLREPAVERDGLFRRAGKEGFGIPAERVLRYPRQLRLQRAARWREDQRHGEVRAQDALVGTSILFAPLFDSTELAGDVVV